MSTAIEKRVNELEEKLVQQCVKCGADVTCSRCILGVDLKTLSTPELYTLRDHLLSEKAQQLVSHAIACAHFSPSQERQLRAALEKVLSGAWANEEP